MLINQLYILWYFTDIEIPYKSSLFEKKDFTY